MKLKNVISTLLLGTFVLVITGCGEPSGPQFRGFSKPHANKGLLYVYRPDSFGAMARNYMAYDQTSGKNLGDLENGTYLEYQTTPGIKKIAIYEKEWNAKQHTALIATSLLSPYGAYGGVSSKPDAVYTVNIRKNQITCLKWDASYRGFNALNGPVDNSTCAKGISGLHKKR